MRNSPSGYGTIAIALHWLVAVTVVCLFLLGLWMVDLTYYDPWYRRAPDIHKGVGILLFLTMLVRLGWRFGNTVPRDEPSMSAWERLAAHTTHRMLYLLLFALMISGYLISTADGRPIQVLGLFSVPALVTGIPDQADVAGKVHWYLAITVVCLASVHALAALKHHFLDKDRTLRRMLRPH
jgi:cytochrome b561